MQISNLTILIKSRGEILEDKIFGSPMALILFQLEKVILTFIEDFTKLLAHTVVL